MKKMMMMVALATATLAASAQHEVGTLSLQPKVGMTVSNITNLSLYYEDGSKVDTDVKFGYQVGAELEYQFAPKMSIAAGVIYSNQGKKWGDFKAIDITDKGTVTSTREDTKYDFDYINVPIVFNYYVAQGLAIKAGVQPAFLTRAKYKLTNNIDGEETKQNHDLKDLCNKFDFSIPVGLSYETSNVVFDARYNFGLTKINKNGDESYKNSVFQLTIGYKFDI